MKIQTHAKCDWLDAGGVATSVLCALHCALMPIIVTVLPVIGLGFLASEAVEWGLITLSALLGISSLCLGYREHRSHQALGILAVGLGSLATGCIVEHRELAQVGVPLVVVGGFLIAASHGLNHWLCRMCRACQQHEDSLQEDTSQRIHHENAKASA
jgi:hypothetical protein